MTKQYVAHPSWEMIDERDATIATLRKALEDIALLDEADGHELTESHAFQAVAIATRALGKHPSEIFADRARAALQGNSTEGK